MRLLVAAVVAFAAYLLGWSRGYWYHRDITERVDDIDWLRQSDTYLGAVLRRAQEMTP